MDMNEPLPVFVHPSEVDFVIGKPETHKSLITIFNPYPWPIRFKILCNAPSKYTVGYTKGLIKQGCYLDTTIRHKNPMNVESNFLRIEIYRANDDEHSYPCGQKELALNVVKSPAFRFQSQQKLIEFADDDQQQQSTSSSSKSQTLQQRSHPTTKLDHPQHRHPNSPNFYWLAIVSFLFCAFILLLPQYAEQNKQQNECDDQHQQQHNSLIPNWMRPTSTSKCISAYVLGILTVYFLQAVPG